MKTTSGNLLLMLLPVAALLAFGWWRTKRAPPAPPKFALTATILKEPVHPVDVWAGRDTKLEIRADFTRDLPPNWQDSDWSNCIRLVAKKNGKERVLFRSYNDTGAYGFVIPLQGYNAGGSSRERWGHFITFSLHKMPIEWGEIWLHFDLTVRSLPLMKASLRSVDEKAIAKIKSQSGTLWVSKSLLLRRTGNAIKLPTVSTNPQLQLRGWKINVIKASKDSRSYQEDRELVMHLFDTGPLPATPPLNQSISPDKRWQFFSARGLYVGGMDGNQVLITTGKGRRHYIAKLQFSSRQARRASRLKGQFSCNQRWPLLIDIPLRGSKK